MTNASKIKNSMLAALLVLVIAGAGCDFIEDQIDNYTVKEFDYSSSFYSGDTGQGAAVLKLVENTTISSLNVQEVNRVALSNMQDPLSAIFLGLENVTLELVGSIQNNSDNEGRAYIFFAPNEEPAENESQLIGSFAIGAGEKFAFSGSEGFDQTPEEVEENILNYILNYPSREVFHVFLYSEGVYTESIAVNYLNLSASPTFLREKALPPIALGSKKQKLEDIVSVGVSGRFTNEGSFPARVVWMVGGSDEELNIEDHVIIDAWVEPGDSILAESGLVAPQGLKTLKGYVKDMMEDARSVEGKMIITSDGGVQVNIESFKVEVIAEVNVYDVNF